MDSLIKKSLLAGMGLALLVTDKIKETAGETKEKVFKEMLPKLMNKHGLAGASLHTRKEEILTEIFAFWYYGIIEDEVEEKLESLVKTVLKKLDIPTRDELEDIIARIAELERRQD